MGELIYNLSVILLVIVFIIWVVKTVKNCNRQNKIEGILDSEIKNNNKNRNIKIISGFILLLVFSRVLYSITNETEFNFNSLNIIVSICVVLFILFIIFMVIKCKNKNKNKDLTEKQKNKNRLITIIICVVVYLVLLGIVQLVKPYFEQKEAIKEQQIKIDMENQEKEKIEQETQYLADTLMVSKEFFGDIQDVFDKCGLGKIKGVIFVDDFLLEDNKTKESVFKVIVENREKNGDLISLVIHDNNRINGIELNGNILYEKDQVIDNAQYYFRYTFNEKSEAKNNFEKYITSSIGKTDEYPKFPKYLDNPSAGDDSYSWGCDKGGFEIAIGWVEAPNIFGVILRKHFKVYIDKKTKSFTVRMQD